MAKDRKGAESNVAETNYPEAMPFGQDYTKTDAPENGDAAATAEPVPPTASGTELGAAYERDLAQADKSEDAFLAYLEKRGCTGGVPYGIPGGRLYTVKQVKKRKRVVEVVPQSD